MPRNGTRGSLISGSGRVRVLLGWRFDQEDLAGLTREVPFARGLGRAYGDAALPASGESRVAATALADRILAFDETTGVLTAEAGLSLDQICQLFLPRQGISRRYHPGTRFVTLSRRMVACDVHGKNHHREGSFGRHVLGLTVRVGTIGSSRVLKRKMWTSFEPQSAEWVSPVPFSTSPSGWSGCRCWFCKRSANACITSTSVSRC